MIYTIIGLILSGIASQYSEGVMEQVIENRQAGKAWVSLPQQLPLVDGYIAVNDCAELGNVWTIKPIDQKHWERHLVVDCSCPGDGTSQWMNENNIMLEVSYLTAVRWNTVGRGMQIERLIGEEVIK